MSLALLFLLASTALDRDLDGYAMASCLASLDDAALKRQGEAWAGGIVERSHGDFEPFLPIARAVKAELERGGVGVAHREDGDLPVPIETCAEMRDRPAVRQAMAKARIKLWPAYRAAK